MLLSTAAAPGTSPMFLRSEYDSRRRQRLQMMDGENPDAIVVYAAKPETGYVRYYTGYEPGLGILNCAFLVVTPGAGAEWTLVTNVFCTLLRQVARITDTGAEVFVRACKPGVTELHLAAVVEYALRRAGSGPFVFSTILCSGFRPAKWIVPPTRRRLETGDLVQLGCGSSCEGYHGDFSRAVCAEEPPPETRKLLVRIEDAVLIERAGAVRMSGAPVRLWDQGA
jgi:hypothetical protein